MASITISRGTPFSAARWVMAVTNSLFMLACPPLLFLALKKLWIGLPCGPNNKKSGGYPLQCEGPTTAPSGRAESKYITAETADSRVGDGLLPLAVAANELDQALVGLLFGHRFFDHFFANIQVDVTRRATDVPEVGVGHFAWPIDNTTHDGDLDA